MFTAEWLPGDYLAFAGMFIVIGLLTWGHLSARRNERRAQQHMDRVLGHPARKQHATQDRRVTEQVWP